MEAEDEAIKFPEDHTPGHKEASKSKMKLASCYGAVTT